MRQGCFLNETQKVESVSLKHMLEQLLCRILSKEKAGLDSQTRPYKSWLCPSRSGPRALKSLPRGKGGQTR